MMRCEKIVNIGRSEIFNLRSLDMSIIFLYISPEKYIFNKHSVKSIFKNLELWQNKEVM
jgi:hypothetical protein